MNVILVDDEQKFVSILAKRLTMRGIKSDIAYHGEDAIEMVKKTAYDVAVLDLKMPGISGVKLKYKLSELNPDLKFIFVTGHGAFHKQDKEIRQDIYLSKPLDIEILIQTIHEITDDGL